MLTELFSRILIMLFVLSSLTTLRHFFYFLQAFLTSTEEVPVKYRLSKTALLFLGVSIAYMVTTIFTGIKF